MSFFDVRPELMSDFSSVFKEVKIEVGFKMPVLEKKEFVVNCKESLPSEPFVLFELSPAGNLCFIG